MQPAIQLTLNPVPAPNPPATNSKPEECTICHDDESEEPLVTLPCKHRFHSECIKQWLPLAKPTPHCPYCRGSLTHACGHHLPLDVLGPGAVIPRGTLGDVCRPCGFRRSFPTAKKCFYELIRTGATLFMAMSEVYPDQSALKVGRALTGGWQRAALVTAWESVGELSHTIETVTEFVRRWRELPIHDRRRTEETPSRDALETLDRLRVAVQETAAIEPASVHVPGTGQDRGPRRLSPSQFPDLYRSLHALVRSMGFEEPLDLVFECEAKEWGREEDEEYDDEEQYEDNVEYEDGEGEYDDTYLEEDWSSWEGPIFV